MLAAEIDASRCPILNALPYVFTAPRCVDDNDASTLFIAPSAMLLLSAMCASSCTPDGDTQAMHTQTQRMHEDILTEARVMCEDTCDISMCVMCIPLLF